MLERYRRAPPPQPLDIHLQGDSLGIHYEGYEKTFIQCIFEEGDVEGKNERYEFRCDSKYECCGRVCCVPENAIIPLWLMIIFIILALLALLALLGTIAYLCAKRRQKPKKPIAARFEPSPMTEEQLPAPRQTRIVQHSAAEIGRLIMTEERDAEHVEPQKAQLAFNRPFVPDPLEEHEYPAPLRHSASFHSVSEISQSQPLQLTTVERPRGRQADVMFTRPGFDNVPSY